MADLIDRSQAMMLLAGEAIAKYPRSFYYGLFAAANEIKELPAVDAVEVVRCGECRYFFVDEYYAKHGLCRAYPLGIAKLPMDYCSLGERRTDATD